MKNTYNTSNTIKPSIDLEYLFDPIIKATDKYGVNTPELDEAIDNSKQALNALMLREFLILIGDNVKIGIVDQSTLAKANRNQLKYELRAAAQRKYGGTSE